MTQEEKRICAERLFDEIGLIDDRFIAEAETPYARPKRVWLRRLLIAAASVTLVVSVGVGALVAGMLADKKDGADADGGYAADGQNGADDRENAEGGSVTLSARLEDLREETAGLAVNEADIELFGSTPKVIWRYEDEESYRMRDISAAEAQQLVLRLSEDGGRRVDGENADGAPVSLWIATGDGTVISPYLEQTAGNVGYGEIFDYSPEYEPSEDFSDYLCDVIS